MKKAHLTGVFVLICVAFVFFASAILSMIAHAANYYEAQSGITIHQNYDITTANDGAYASKSVDPSLFSNGSYYTALYSGGTVDVTNGYMYEAAASGETSTVRLFDEYSGTFSIFGQGFYDANSSPYDYGKLSFTFTNLANTRQYISFSFYQTASNYLTFNAYYYDLDVQETAIYKTASDMNLMASFTATSVWMTGTKKTALKFSYNNSTQALDLRNSSSVGSHNLNTLLGTTLTAFSSYSVDMSFENKDREHTAKFIIYELCGNLLDVVVQDNYDITTANDGAYASKSVDPNNFGATSYYTGLYSGDRLDVTKGRLYMAAAKNATSTIRLFNVHSGTFSIVGQGFYDADNRTYDYNRLTFQFTNTANTNQYIKLVFIQKADDDYLELAAYYYDKGIQTSAINQMSSNMKLMASFTATSNYMTNKNKTALKFSYDNSTQALNLANSGSTKDHNLNTLLSATLPTFSSYSVDMAFEQKGQTNTAKFIAYELCGANFSEARTMTVKDMSGETVSENVVFKGQTVILPADNVAGFVGCMIDGEIYPAGYKYTVSTNFEMQKMVISPTIISGAYIRLTTENNYGGIRFGIKVNDNDMDAFGENIEMHGVIIRTANIVGEFDLDEAKSVDKALDNYFTDGDDRMYFIALTDIDSANYNTSYSVRAYLKITMYDGSYVKRATDYSTENNARTPYYVAAKAKEEGYSGAVIDEYLGL